MCGGGELARGGSDPPPLPGASTTAGVTCASSLLEAPTRPWHACTTSDLDTSVCPFLVAVIIQGLYMLRTSCCSAAEAALLEENVAWRYGGGLRPLEHSVDF